MGVQHKKSKAKALKKNQTNKLLRYFKISHRLHGLHGFRPRLISIL